ncbi:hypothetical protein [Streptomyces sp. NPDC059816]|uniref:hypothetical protein n=1 Tax=Streptomyces sp. NPDC059816 TaxID=3346960 RepID=UPI0036521CDE
MKHARTPSSPPADAPSHPPGAALELLVHGVGGASAPQMLNDPRTVRVTGDDTAAVHRRAGDLDAERRPAGDGRPVPEAYVWSNLTSGSGSRALWLLLLPFMVVNLAHWMRPASDGGGGAARAYALCVRLVALTLTVLFVAAACEVALDLLAWQCAGSRRCAAELPWFGFLSPDLSPGGWWTQPGRRLALAALAPTALTGLLWYLSHRTWNAYESQKPPDLHSRTPDAPDAPTAAEADGPVHRPDARTPLARPGFWYGRRLVARLRAAHTAAALLTVAAAVTAPALGFDHRSGDSGPLTVLGVVVTGVIATVAALAVAVVGRRGRSERRPDRRRDGARVRFLPLVAVGVLTLAVGYAGWSRPGWRSHGRLPGDLAFGALALLQWALVLVLAVVAHSLYRRAPDTRTALRGFGGPAATVLACALGGVMAGGGAHRTAVWLDDTGPPAGGGAALPGPPVLLSWQAAVLPPLLLVVVLVLAGLSAVALHRARTGTADVRADYPEEHPACPPGAGPRTPPTGDATDGSAAAAAPGGPPDTTPEDAVRARNIALARAGAALTDRAPLVVGTLAAATLVCQVAALAGAWATRALPTQAVAGAPEVVTGAVDLAQAGGSWLVGAGFLLLVVAARRAYRDPKARRTIGILWDVGTFWPRAAHPFAPPCYAERAVPDLTWRVHTWTRRTRGRLIISGHSQGSVLAAAAAWQLAPRSRERVALLTYGSPLERLYGRWFPSCFGSAALADLHRDVDCWRNLYRRTDPIGGPVLLPGDRGPEVDGSPLKDPLAYGRTFTHPLPAPILGHSDYQADPVFARERERLLDRLRPPAVPPPRPDGEV